MNALAVEHCRAICAAIGITAVVASLWSSGTICCAQQNPLVAQKPAIGRILRGQSLADPQNAKLFDDYFNRFFRQFINPSPRPETFPDLRHDLHIFRVVGQKGAAYDRLNAMSYKYMAGIAASAKYGTAARVNAMLILGDLNEQEGGQPLAKAFRPLLLFATGDSFRGKPIPDELKVAAMVGLNRWASLKAVPSEQQAALAAAMLKLLGEQTPPAGRTAVGHNWMRRIAADILASLGSPGPKNEVVAAYEKVIANASARDTLRCETAESVGKLKFPQGSNVDFASLANLIGHQTVEICQRELDATERKPRRRLFAYALRSALLGLGGGNGRGGLKAASAGTDGQQFVEAVRGPIDAAYETVEDENVDLTSVSDAVETMIGELQSLLRDKPAPAEDSVAAGQESAGAEQPDARAAARPPAAAGN